MPQYSAIFYIWNANVHQLVEMQSLTLSIVNQLISDAAYLHH